MCCVKDCNNAPRERCVNGPCEMHYYRMRRNGSYELKEKTRKAFYKHCQGYIVIYDEHHPLSKKGLVYEHRKILYDLEPDMHCWNCGDLQTWDICHVDHIDETKDNNDPDNLRISCAVCNQQRNREILNKIIRDNGIQISYNGESHCIEEWARKLGFNKGVLNYRLQKGWAIHDALTKPVRVKVKNAKK